MFEWLSDTSNRASRSKRARRSASDEISSSRSLIATELGVFRSVRLSHAALAEQLDNLVRPGECLTLVSSREWDSTPAACGAASPPRSGCRHPPQTTTAPRFRDLSTFSYSCRSPPQITTNGRGSSARGSLQSGDRAGRCRARDGHLRVRPSPINCLRPRQARRGPAQPCKCPS